MRWRGWAYDNPGGYFVTVCAETRGAVFGHLMESNVALNRVGVLVAEQLQALEGVDSWVVMPDHVHAILVFEECRQALGEVVGRFKSITARETRGLRGPARLWQRGYYDHVIRDEEDLGRVREYIATNPIRAAWRDAGLS
jgi:putative transposase